MAPEEDPRRHPHNPESPEADALEQDIPLADEEDGAGGPVPDSERVEPLDDSDYGHGE
ncbi:MAG TPA: hypothetical protein VL961_09790 [Acidimicrobiales bacterium]|nr:hypothetical protein [Acidimicrobiales bacterium]